MSYTDLFFSTPTADFSRFDWMSFGLFGGLLVIAAVAKLVQLTAVKNNAISAALFRRLANGTFVSGILGAMWAAVRYLSVPYLGIRFVAGLIILGFLTWLYFFAAYLFFRYDREKKEWLHNQVKNRYLRGNHKS